jgi:hypothetical protein
MPMGGWDSTPACIEHGVSGNPYPNVYVPYEKCADFFTFGPGSTINTFSDGVSTSYWILTAIGFIVMVIALIGWVVTEDRKLKRQAAYLLKEGVAKTVHEELGVVGGSRGT